MKVFGYLLALIRALGIALSILIYLFGYAISTIFKKHTTERAFALRRTWLKLANRILGHRIEFTGKPIQGAALYISNHRTFSDPIIQTMVLDAFIIAKAEVGNIPIVSKGAEVTGIIYVKRESLKSRKETRDSLLNTLNSGYNVLVYPEGTVGEKAKTKPFKKGTFNTAATHNYPVVPIAIEYKKERNRWQNRSLGSQYFKQYGNWRTQIKVEIGPALRSEDGRQLTKDCHDWINQKLGEMQDGWAEEFVV